VEGTLQACEHQRFFYLGASLGWLQLFHIPDPISLPRSLVAPVAEILARVPAKQLMQLYKIAAFQDPDQFLQHVAHARGKLRKGGVPDMPAAAKVVLQVRGTWGAGVAQQWISLCLASQDSAADSFPSLTSIHLEPYSFLCRVVLGLERRPHSLLHIATLTRQRGVCVGGDRRRMG